MLRWFVAIMLVQVWLWSLLPMARAQDDAKVKKLITQFLEDKDVKKRRLALVEIEILGAPAKGVVQALTIALERDTESVVRREVALVLGRMGLDGKEAIPALAQALKADKDDQVRELAARALLQMTPQSNRALKQLVDALQDNHAPTRAAAAETINVLGKASKSAVPQLVEYLKMPKDKTADAGARMYVALALGRVGQEGAKAAPVLIAVLLDAGEESSVREAAADSLGRLGLDASGAAKPLADTLQNVKNGQVLRIAAVKALAKVEGDTRQIWPALKVGLLDSDSTIRILTVRASGLYAKEEPEAITILAKLARGDDNVEIRLAAIQELGLLGAAARGAEADLRYIIDNDDREAVRQQALIALKKVQAN